MTETGIVSKKDLPAKVAVLWKLLSSEGSGAFERVAGGLLVVWFAAEIRLSERQSAAVINYFAERDPERLVSLKTEFFAWLRSSQATK